MLALITQCMMVHYFCLELDNINFGGHPSSHKAFGPGKVVWQHPWARGHAFPHVLRYKQLVCVFLALTGERGLEEDEDNKERDPL